MDLAARRLAALCPDCGIRARAYRCKRCPACDAVFHDQTYEKNRAQHAARKALARGRLARAPCSVCGATKAMMHHEDYAMPLVVTWLCSSCHQRRHVALDFSARLLLAQARV